MWDFKSLWPSFVKSLKYFILGLLVTTISLLVFLNMTDHFPQASQMVGQKYTQINTQFWDPHRHIGSLLTIGLIIAAISFLFSLSLLVFFKNEIPVQTIFPLRIMIVAGIIGGGGILSHYMPYELVSSISPYIFSAMPSRWLNINVLGIFPLFIGLSAYYKDNFGIQLSLGFFVITLALILTFHPGTNWGRFILGIILFSICGLLLFLKIPPKKITFLANIKLRSSVPRGIAIVTLFVISMGMGRESYGAFEPNKKKLLNWSNDAMFNRIYQDSGYLLIAPGLDLPLQLYTRSTVFPGNIIPCLAYTPRLGPMVKKYMKDISGVDIFNPSIKTRKIHRLPISEVKSFWQSKTLGQWQDIKKEYGITQVFTLSNWKLLLPVLQGPEKKALNSLDINKHNQTREYIVYQIP